MDINAPAAQNHKAWHGFLMGLAAFATYNAMDVFIKKLSTVYPIMQILFFGIFLSLPLIYLFVRRLDGPTCMATRAPRTQIFRGVLYFLYTAAGFYGLQNLPLANFYTFVFTTPLFTVLFAIFWLKEKVSPLQIALMSASFVGVIVAFRPDPNAINTAALVVIIGTVAGGLSQAVMRRQSASEGLGASIIYPELVTSVLAFIFMVPVFVWPTPEDWGWLFLVAVLSAIGNSLLVMAFFRAPASQVAPTHYSQIIWGTLLGYFIFGDVPDQWVITGAAIIILAGIGLARLEYQTTHGGKNA